MYCPGDLCAFCATQVFTKPLHDRLLKRRTSGRREPIISRYSQTTSNLCISTKSGCVWCSILVNRILQAEDLKSSTHQEYAMRTHEQGNESINSAGNFITGASSSTWATIRAKLFTLGQRNPRRVSHASDIKQSTKVTEESGVNNSDRELMDLAKLKRFPGAFVVTLTFTKSFDETTFSMLKVAINLSQESHEYKQGELPTPFQQNEVAMSLSFELFGSNTSDSNLFPMRSEDLNLASSQHLEIANRWIAQCKKHKECAPPNEMKVSTSLQKSIDDARNKLEEDEINGSNSTADETSKVRELELTWAKHDLKMLESIKLGTATPEHLIDITLENAPRIMAHSKFPAKAKYVALSYVWGRTQTYVLTKSTLQEKCRCLDVDQLPKTILEAIHLTRELGFSYLWVDSLCIVQDNNAHNGGEIAMMDEIYADSEVTIIAAKAKSAEEGFLNAINPQNDLIEPVEITFSAEDGPLEFVRLGYRRPYASHWDPINTRGWTLQERISSRRSLTYSSNGLYWSCQACDKSTCSPPDVLMFPDTKLPSKPPSKAERSEDFLRNIRKIWSRLRTEYSARKLSYDGDKLRAISAVIRRVMFLTGWECVAGMFLETLFLDLHWRRRGPFWEGHIAWPRAPSWSWASINSEIEDLSDVDQPPTPFHFRIAWEEVQHWKDIVAKNPLYLECQLCSIIVETRLISVIWKIDGPTDLMLGKFLLYDPKSHKLRGRATLESTYTRFGLYLPTTEIMCMSLSLHAKGHVQGLLLLGSSRSSRWVERIGFCEIDDPSVFDDVEDSIIYIQ